MINRFSVSLWLVLLSVSSLVGQPNCIFTHYSSEQGLSQNSITCMAQDKNGNMWFSTWDGINRFNGYDFKVYKSSHDNQLALANNRVDVIITDNYNMVWLLTYDSRVFRLDQATERVEQVMEEGDKLLNNLKR